MLNALARFELARLHLSARQPNILMPFLPPNPEDGFFETIFDEDNASDMLRKYAQALHGIGESNLYSHWTKNVERMLPIIDLGNEQVSCKLTPLVELTVKFVGRLRDATHTNLTVTLDNESKILGRPKSTQVLAMLALADNFTYKHWGTLRECRKQLLAQFTLSAYVHNKERSRHNEIILHYFPELKDV